MKDLVVLSADRSMEMVLKAVLARDLALGIRPIEVTWLTHMNRDGGVRTRGAELLRTTRRDHSHALMMLDFEGSGTSVGDGVTLETDLDIRLRELWPDGAAKCIAIEPELEAWLWGSDSALEQSLDWHRKDAIRLWLEAQGFELGPENKPRRPKEAMQAVIRSLKLPMSAALYAAIANKISLKRCSDPSFCRLRDQLRNWFPTDSVL